MIGRLCKGGDMRRPKKVADGSEQAELGAGAPGESGVYISLIHIVWYQ